MPSPRSVRAYAVASFIAGGLALGVSLFAQAPAPKDERAVRQIVNKYVEAREAQDAKAIEPLFTSDADQLVSDGTWRRGREALVRGMLESSRKNPAKRSITVESVRFLTPELALVDGRYVQLGRAGAEDRQMWTTIVVKRTAEGWRITAIRNMLPAPAAAAQAKKA
jgi:uncharacterized protein (TIGR02246 family)